MKFNVKYCSKSRKFYINDVRKKHKAAYKLIAVCSAVELEFRV